MLCASNNLSTICFIQSMVDPFMAEPFEKLCLNQMIPKGNDEPERVKNGAIYKSALLKISQCRWGRPDFVMSDYLLLLLLLLSYLTSPN